MSEVVSALEKASFHHRQKCIACASEDLLELSAGRFDEDAVGQFINQDPWGEHPMPFLAGQPWRLVSCKTCTTKFHQYILTETWNERRFSRWMSHDAIVAFKESLGVRGPNQHHAKSIANAQHALRLERLTRPIRGSAPVRLLDFGCGYGEFLAMCSAFGFEAVGVDRSAAKRNNNKFLQVHAELADVSHLAPFHALTLFEVLEHLDAPLDLLVSLGSWVAPGGVLVLEVPDCSGINTISTREEYLKVHPLEHINAFTPKTLAYLAARAGFRPITKPVSIVTSDGKGYLKGLGKYAKAALRKATTQQYFRKL